MEKQRILGKSFKLHTDGNTAPLQSRNINLTGHPVTFEHVKMCNEDNKTRRRVKKAVEIYKDG